MITAIYIDQSRMSAARDTIVRMCRQHPGSHKYVNHNHLIALDPVTKIRHTIDALFGEAVSRHLPTPIRIGFSKKNNRIRSVHYDDVLLCTFRIDGGVAITPAFAEMLLKSRRFRHNCVEVTDEAAPFILQGRSVFAKHVVWCGNNVMIGDDTPVLHNGRVIAVGRAVLSAPMMRQLDKGVAIRVRDSLKR